ncbi:MAG: hypothetical protein R6U66_07940 [Bacteroidales bacterium]
MHPSNHLEKQRKKLIRIFFAILITASIFLGIALYFAFSQDGGAYFSPRIQRMFKIAMGLYTLIVIFSSRWTYQKRISMLPKALGMAEKLILFRRIYLLHLISIEGALFFTYVALMITSDVFILLFVILLLVIVVSLYPSHKYLNRVLPD